MVTVTPELMAAAYHHTTGVGTAVTATAADVSYVDLIRRLPGRHADTADLVAIALSQQDAPPCGGRILVIVVQADFAIRITRGHGDDHRSRGRNDGDGRGTSQQGDPLLHKRYLPQRQAPHRLPAPGPFGLQASARRHSGHPGPGIAPERHRGSSWPRCPTARLQRLPWPSTAELRRSEF